MQPPDPTTPQGQFYLWALVILFVVAQAANTIGTIYAAWQAKSAKKATDVNTLRINGHADMLQDTNKQINKVAADVVPPTVVAQLMGAMLGGNAQAPAAPPSPVLPSPVPFGDPLPEDATDAEPKGESL